MSDPVSKTFDCVQNMRQIRDRFSGEIANMTYHELVRWFRSYRYADPFLQRLAEKTAQQTDAADRVARGS